MITPEIGMGATVYMWSDRYPCTITYISKSGKTIEMREDKSIRTDNNGMSDVQIYEYQRNSKGKFYKARKTKDGIWKIGGQHGTLVIIGQRRRFHDFSF